MVAATWLSRSGWTASPSACHIAMRPCIAATEASFPEFYSEHQLAQREIGHERKNIHESPHVRGFGPGTRPMRVERYQRVDEITTCHVLFISRSEESRLGQILASLKDRHILIVGDSDDFIQRAGMIQLATSQGKIHLRINVNAAKTSNLTISSKLLRSAELVTGSK